MSIPVTELFAKLGLDVDEGAWSSGISAVGGLKLGLAAVSAAASAVGLALAGSVKSLVDYGSNVNDLSARTGVAADKLQRYGHVAGLAGVSFEELAQSMNFAARKGVKNVDTEIGKVADQVKRLTDQGRGAEAAKLAMDHFGRSGARLVPFLKGGSRAIADQADEFEALGVVLDKKTIAATDELGDRIDVANAGLKGLAYTIARPLLRPLTDMVNRFIEWMKVNRKIIAAKIHVAFEALAAAFKTLSAAAKSLWQLVEGVWWAIKKIAGSKPLLIGIASAIALAVAPSAAVAIAANAAVLGWLALAAIVALVIDDVKTWVEGGDSLIGDLLGNFKDFKEYFDDPNAEKPGWFVWLEAGWQMLKNLQGTWNALKSEWKSGNFLNNIAGELKINKNALLAGASAALPPVGMLLGASPFAGGAASPTASASFGTAPIVIAPQVNQTLNVEQPAGMSGPDFAREVADRSNDNLEKIFQEAHAGGM